MVGPDDYASMREVIRRRYGRVQRDGLTPPVIIPRGKHHIGQTVRVRITGSSSATLIGEVVE